MFKSPMGYPSTPLESRAQLGSLNAVASPGMGMRASSSMLSSSCSYEPQFQLSKFVEQWKSKDISRWIEGLGDEMYPHIGAIRNTLKSGRQLECLDDELLKSIGILDMGARKTIQQAVALLLNMCHESESENLQRIALKVTTSCNHLERTMQLASRMRLRASRRSEIVQILNNVSNAFLELSENAKRLVFWLDRTPFDEIGKYVEMRNRIATMVWNLLRNINVQPKALFDTAHRIVEMSKQIARECLKIVDEQDPLVIYGTFVETATLKRSDDSVGWGFNIQSSFRGIHVISEIKEGSPSDACSKLDAGDEILMINGRTVIGWDLTSVAKKISASKVTELVLVVRRRPREPQVKSKVAVRMLSPASQKVYSTENEASSSSANAFERRAPISRHRSLDAIGTVPASDGGAERRTSLASTEPRKEVKRFGGDQWDDAWNVAQIARGINEEEEEALIRRVAKRTRTMRHQPDGYVRSFIDNKLVCDIEDDVVSDELTFDVKCPTEFAEIVECKKDELERMNIAEPRVSDEEWRRPFSGETTRRRAHDSIDSPRVFGVLASPSTSSMASVSSPAARTTPVHSDVPTTPDELPGSPGVAAYSSMEKLFEGWVRRRKTRAELSTYEVTNKWPKCWMCLRGCYLLIYTNQYVKRPDITINLLKSSVSDSTDLKTSKKNIFRITCAPIDYHFSCLSTTDWRNWIQKLKMVKEVYASQRLMSQSVSNETEAFQPMHNNLMMSSTLPRSSTKVNGPRN